MTQGVHTRIMVLRFLDLRAALFGVCMLNFLVSLIYVRRVELEAKAALAAGYWGYTEHWNPVAVIWEPVLLLTAVVGLLINRWWSQLVSLLASARVVYLLGYLSWNAVHNAHDLPMFSQQAIEKLWFGFYQPRPQYLFEVVIGGIIFTYAVLLLCTLIYLRRSSASSAANTGLERTRR